MALMLGSAAPTFARKVETQNRFLVKAVTLGSQMGDMPENLDSKRVYYYYNTDGKLVGSSTYGRNYTDGGYSDTFSLTDIEKIIFDVNGNMTTKTSISMATMTTATILSVRHRTVRAIRTTRRADWLQTLPRCASTSISTTTTARC